VQKAREKKKMKKPIRELPLRKLVVAYPDETLDQVVGTMLSEEVSHILVVDRENKKKLLGLLTRTDLIGIRKRRT